MADMDYKGAWELAELENSNLRKCLKWAAGHLTPGQIRELCDMIQRPLDDGGVIQDSVEAEYAYAVEFKELAVKAADLIDQALMAGDTNTRDEVVWFKAALYKGYWFARAADVLNKLRGYEPPSPEANLAEIRNIKDAFNDEKTRHNR